MTEPLFQNFLPHVVKSEWADRVVTGAYDALGPAERNDIANNKPYSYLNVTRSPGDDPEANLGTEELLALGRSSLDFLLEAEVFETADEPGLVVYRLTLDGHSQVGVVGLMPVEAAVDGRIRKHEDVRPARAELLARHLEVVGAASSPVALTHKTDEHLDAVIGAVTTGEPTLSTNAGNVEQEVWLLDSATSDRLQQLLQNKTFYITDGHHRFAAAAVAAGRHDKGSPFHRVLVVSFPSDELRVLPFHRRVAHRADLVVDDLLERLAQLGELRPLSGIDDAPPPPGETSVYVANTWYRLVLPKRGETAGVDGNSGSTGISALQNRVSGLDVSVLQDSILDPIFGISEPNADPNIEYVADPIGIDELVRRCDRDGGVAFILAATSISDIMNVADSNGLMPPKSSYFDPKPRSGLFLRILDER